MSQEKIVVPKGWELETLGSVCEPSKYGYTSKSHIEKQGIPYIRITDINEDGITLRSNMVYVDIDDKKFQTYKLQKGDILIARTADVGRSFLFDEDKPMIFASYLIRFRPKQKIIQPKFLLYTLKTNFFWTHIGMKTTTTAVSNINANNLSKFKFACPPPIIQKQIVTKLDHILGELKVKKKQILFLIEQNKERIDFFEKNWMSYIIDKKIDKHPQRENWKLTIFGDTFEESNGEWLPSNKSKIVNYIGLENIESNTGILVNFTPTESSKIKSSKTIFNKSVVLYGKLRPYLNKVLLPEFDGICSTDILSLNPKSNVDREFLAYFLRSWYVLSIVNKSVHGTKMPRTKIQVLQEIPIRLPNLSTQKQIVQNIKNAEEKFKEQKIQFENIKQNYDSKINYINHIQSSILDSAFSGKLLN